MQGTPGRHLLIVAALLKLLPLTAFSQSADLRLAKSVDDVVPLVGSRVTFTISVVNDGPGVAGLVQVTDILPAGVKDPSSSTSRGVYNAFSGLWDIGTMAKEDSVVLHVTVTVAGSTTITNVAEITRSTVQDPDSHPGNGHFGEDDIDRATIVPQEQSTFWTPANQAQGTVTAMTFVSALPKQGGDLTGTVLVGTDGGGIHRSTDAGENWFPVANELSGSYIRGLDTGHRNAVWTATYGEGVWRSGHVGTAFLQRFGTNVHPSQTDYALSLVVNTANEKNAHGDGDVFVGTDGSGVYVSVNEGGTWTNVGTTGAAPLPPRARIVRTLEIDVAGAGAGRDRVYIGTHGGGVYYVDYAAGPTAPNVSSPWVEWNGSDGALNDAVIHGLAVDEASGRIYAATDRGVYDRHVTSAVWTLSLEGVIARDVTVITCGNASYVVAATDGSFIYHSANAGATWTQTQRHSAVHVNNSGLRTASVLTLHQAGSHLFAGTQGAGVHRSDDCGFSWNQVSNAEVIAVIQDMVFDPASDRIYAGTYGHGVLVSNVLHHSSMLSWTRINRGLTNQWVYAMERADHAIIAGTWGGGIFRTADGGENWRFMGLAGRIIYDVLYNPVTRMLYASTDRGEVARSVDRGLTWQEFGVAATALWSIGLGETPATIYVGTFGAGVYKSSDQGRTFFKTGLQVGHIFDFAYGTNPKTGKKAVFAATSIGVKYSEDGGFTWHDLNTGLTVTDVRSIIFAGSDLVCGTWGGGAFVYDPAAKSWVRDGLPATNIVAFALIPEGSELFVSTESGIFRKRVEATATDAPLDAELPSDYVFQQNYPNPFNPTTEIEFALPVAGDVRLAVYDGLGRQVEVLAEGSHAAGNHTVRFDATGLASGVYIYRLESGGRILKRKMVFMK